MTKRSAKLLPPSLRGLVLLAVVGLLWLSLRNAAIALFGPLQPSMALAFWPPSGAAIAADASLKRIPPDRQAAAAAAALRRDPVSHWPLVAAAEAAIRRGDTERAAVLLEAAVRRNSRHADARGRLFQFYMTEGRWSEGVDEGLLLARLRPAMADNVMEALLMLLDDDRGRAVLAAKLQDRRHETTGALRAALTRAAAGRPAERRLGALLASLRTPTRASGGDFVDWVRRLPPSALPHVRGVYDGEFRQLPGEPPFGWNFASQANASAAAEGEAGSPGLLAARTTSLQPLVLARQTTLLSPGAYSIAVDAAADGGPMTWRLACRTGRLLAEIPIPGGERPARVERSFAVPPGCEYQDLILIGAAAGSGTPAVSRTRRIAVSAGL